MSLIARIFRNFNGKRLRTAPIPKSTPEILDTDDPIEEQKLPWYTSQHYYPVRIGEIFNKRYQTIAKLGFGATSTVWLAKDTRRFVQKGEAVALSRSGADYRGKILVAVGLFCGLEAARKQQREA